MRTIFLDLETTGFASKTGYNSTGKWVKENVIIEVAAMLYDEKEKEVIDTFHEYIRPDTDKIPAHIEEYTGITNEMVINCRSEKEVLLDFVEWLMEKDPNQIVGHNIKPFDWRFIKDKAKKYNLSLRDFNIVDTLTEARRKTKEGSLPIANHKQETLASYFGIKYQAHSAIEDVKALIMIYEKLGLNKTDLSRIRKDFGF